MLKANKLLFAILLIFVFQINSLGYSHAKNDGHLDRFNTKLESSRYSSTYVTYKTDPEHYDVPGNASRTCGKGYNPMNKQHRRNHRYKRAHVHPNVPWRPGCSD